MEEEAVRRDAAAEETRGKRHEDDLVRVKVRVRVRVRARVRVGLRLLCGGEAGEERGRLCWLCRISRLSAFVGRLG